MKKFFDFFSSPLIPASLGLPMAFFYAAGVGGIGRSFSPFEHSSAFRIYSVFFVLSALIMVFSAVRIRAYARALIGAGAVLILAQAVLSYGFRWSGNADIGEGEQFEKYSSVYAGPWAKPVPLPLMVKTVKPGSSAACTIILGNEHLEIAGDRHFLWKDLNLKAAQFFSAPLFLITNAEGKELDAGYIKLAFEDPENDFFQFEAVPHRFYVSLPGIALRTWKLKGDRWGLSVDGRTANRGGFGTDAPEKLHLRIIRGKLALFEGEVKKGESVPFDGHNIRFERRAAWVRIEVRKEQKMFLLYAGLAAVIFGVIVKAVRRERYPS